MTRLATPSLVALLAVAALAQPIAAQRASVRAAAIDSVVARRIASNGPGCVLGLARGDSLVFWRGYGLADVEAQTPFTPSTGFSPGSVYKHFYDVAILLLARDGRLSLDDDVRRWVPELPDYGARITVRQLLDHTHGLREYPALEDLSPPDAGIGDTGIMRLLARQRAPVAPPGTHFQYGNTGPFLAGLVIARAAGEATADFIARRVFDPAGMRSSSVAEGVRSIPPAAPRYAAQPGGGLKRSPPPRNMRTTLEDLARWNGLFETADTAWRAVLGQLTTPSRLANGTTLDYGFGLRMSPYRGLRRQWAPGASVGARAMFMRFPDARLTILLGCNRDDLSPIELAESVADVALADEIARAERGRAAPRPVALTPVQQRAVVGAYAAPGGHLLRVEARGDRLRVVLDSGWNVLRARDAGMRARVTEGGSYDLVASSPTHFTIAGRPRVAGDEATEVIFTPARRGSPRSLEVRTLWYPVRFTAVEPVDPRTVVVADYLGDYASDETGGVLHVEERNGGLVLRAPRGEYAMDPVARDLFRAGLMLMRFRRDDGRVTAVVTRGLTFVRGRSAAARLDAHGSHRDSSRRPTPPARARPRSAAPPR